VRWTNSDGVEFSLHEACYEGRLDAVIYLLEHGADPNGDASPDDWHHWVSAAGEHPRPLHCVAIAWNYQPEHAEIAKRLIAHGAVVEDTVLDDYWIETTLTDAAIAVGVALGLDAGQLRGKQQQQGGGVEDRYAGNKVLFVRGDDTE
jgi:hypothetical protein